MTADKQDDLEDRVVRVAEAALEEKKSVTAIDVLEGLGWLPRVRVDEWRQGRIDCLERVVMVNLRKLSAAMRLFRRWARRRGLIPSETAYVARTRDRRSLRFGVRGDPEIERAYRTHWVSPELSEQKRARLAERRSRAPDLVVISPLKTWTCTGCAGTGGLLLMEGAGPLCMDCADLDHLVYLPAGDAALTRRARRASRLSAVVVRFSRSRKRYERQGILIEEAALERAEQECLVDEEARARRRQRGGGPGSPGEDRARDRAALPRLSRTAGAGDRPPHRHARKRAGGADGGGARARLGGDRAGGRRVGAAS